MRDRLSKLSLRPNENRPAHGTVLAQEDSQTPSKRKPDSGGAEKQTPATGLSSNKKKQSKHMDKDEEKGVKAWGIMFENGDYPKNNQFLVFTLFYSYRSY